MQDDPHRGTLLAEWRTWHGGGWIRADDLHADVRRLIDAKDRTAAIRQKLPKLTSTPIGGLKLESEARGNAARRVTFYRVAKVA